MRIATALHGDVSVMYVIIRYIEEGKIQMNKIIPERLTIAREALGITKAEAARRCGLSKIGYCRYEYGDRTPSLQTTEILAQRLGTSVDYLIGNSDDRNLDQITVYRKTTPFLFELSRICATDEEMAKRLIDYYYKIRSDES